MTETMNNISNDNGNMPTTSFATVCKECDYDPNVVIDTLASNGYKVDIEYFTSFETMVRRVQMDALTGLLQ